MEHAVQSRDNIDRLSSLPDSLLHHIMSFLTARQCVSLWLLSKRWKNLWTTLPFLWFDERDFAQDPSGNRFTEFVTTTLLLRDSNSRLHTFCLCHHKHLSFYASIRPWITYAINCNPLVLHISLILANALPQCLFTCQSLEDVSIDIMWPRGYRITSTPEFISLPNLRRLRLSGIVLNDNFLDMLFSGCILLEDLDLDDCKLEFSTLSSATLKYLTITDHAWKHSQEDNLIERINTPSLISFYFDSSEVNLKDGVLVNMPSLEHAALGITSLENPNSSGHMGKCNLLSGISNVEDLTLYCYNIKEPLESVLPTCPEFSNLRNLSMILCLGCNLNLVASFLEHSPNLKNLTLRDARCCMEELGLQGDNGQHKSIRISAFQCTQLGSVEVIYSSYDADFLEVMKSLLDGTKGCGNVQIIIRKEEAGDDELNEFLNSFMLTK